jgi:hypothetical protein
MEVKQRVGHSSERGDKSGRGQTYEKYKPELARLAPASAVDSPSVPALQFRQIQTGGVTVIRWPAGDVRIAAGSLHVLLATVLLDYFTRRECWITSRLFQ